MSRSLLGPIHEWA